MKLRLPTYLWALTLLAVYGLYLSSCRHEDPVPAPSETTSSTDLLSIQTNTPVTLDGTIDAGWEKAPRLAITPTVPDPGNDLFTGYIGQKYSATLRSMYDDKYVYFLAEIQDPTKSVFVATWYFNPLTKQWTQEATSAVFDANGIKTREGFGEDKFAMLWNIDGSTPKFLTQTCYASCHVFSPYMDYAVSPGVVRSNAASGNHYTNGANEKIDMWWAHLGRDILFNQMDDNYQDYAGGAAVTILTGGNANGRHVDDLVVTGTSTVWPFRPVYSTGTPQGSSNNRQTLKLDGNGAAVGVPAWIIPNAANYYAILAGDTLSGGKAVKITGVSSTGVLTYAGGQIDPNTDRDYQRTSEAANGGTGTKCFPSYIASPLLGGRADISCAAIHTGSQWIVEYKRLLKTPDQLKQDVDFSSLGDFPFGVAIWDHSNNQHGIQPNLTLKFKK